MSRGRFLITLMATLGIACTVATGVYAQQQPWLPGKAVTFIDLGADEPFPNDLALLDVFIRANPSKARLLMTTNGRDAPPTPLLPGILRAIDLDLPLPDLQPLDGFDGTGWGSAPGGADFIVQPEVDNWNAVLDAFNKGKGSSQRGIVSHNGIVFVGVRQESSDRDDGNGPPWNGLSRAEGTAPPDSAFGGPPDELYSSPSAGDEARPQGSAIGLTGTGHAFLFVTNFSGKDAAGCLRVLDVTSPDRTTSLDSATIDMYQFLAGWVDSPASPDGPLGHEVPSEYFWSPTCLQPGEKTRAVHVVHVPDDPAYPNAGCTLLFVTLNLDPVWPPVDVPDDVPPGINWQGYLPWDALSGSCQSQIPGAPIITRDDGKYDYVAVTDITAMTGDDAVPSGSWYYKDQFAWAEHTKFLRLPPDLPDGWDWADDYLSLSGGGVCTDVLFFNNPPSADCFFGQILPPGSVDPQEGYDFSTAELYSPFASSPFVVPILGSGTPCGLATHPCGRWVYVLTTDDGIDPFYDAVEPTPFPAELDPDSIWEMPHLYAIDLQAVDVTNQASLDAYSSQVEKARFNKTVAAFLGLCSVNQEDSRVYAQKFLHSGTYRFVSQSISTDPGDGYVDDLPVILGPDLEPLEFEISGENFYDPTPKARMLAVHNDFMSVDRDRLYIAAAGWTVASSGPLGQDPSLPMKCEARSAGHKLGVVYVFRLPDEAASSGMPEFMRKILLPLTSVNGLSTTQHTYRINGMVALPATLGVLGFKENGVVVDNAAARNVIAVNGEDWVSTLDVPPPTNNRLFLIQDKQ